MVVNNKNRVSDPILHWGYATILEFLQFAWALLTAGRELMDWPHGRGDCLLAVGGARGVGVSGGVGGGAGG